MKKLLVFLLLLPTLTLGQHLPGLMSSNYGGIYRALQNPSAVAGSRYKYQVVVGVNSSVNSNYFLRPFSRDLLHLGLVPYQNDINRDLRSVGSLTDAPRHAIYTEVIGPSVLFSPDRRQSFALHTRVRSYGWGAGFPTDLTNAYGYRLISPKVVPTSGQFSGTIEQLQHAEVGITYGLRVFEGKWHRLSLGATGRRLFGGSYRSLQLSSQYAILPKNTSNESPISLTNLALDLTTTAPQPNVGNTGAGWAIDYGFTYEIGKRITGRNYNAEAPFADPRPAYLVRLSASVLNTGSINLPIGTRTTGTNSQKTLTQADLERIGNNPITQLPTLTTAPKTTETLARQQELPRLLNVEADLRLGRGFFLNGLLQRNLTDGPNYATPNQTIITARFEDEDTEFALPVSIIEGNERVAVGASVRLGPMSVGLNDLVGLLNKSGSHRASAVWLGVSVWGWQPKH
jgi:Family of unknown function (DUF5723)